MRGIYALVYISTLFPLAIVSAAWAQEQSEPKVLRFELGPFVGYRTSMSFPLHPNATLPNPRFVLESNPSYGVSFGVPSAKMTSSR
jgi:hypothetical protein